MKITLVSPPQPGGYPQPPLGLATIAAVLEAAGHAVVIYDANVLRLNPEDAAARLPTSDVLGLTAMTPTIESALTIARKARQLHPAMPIVIGGAHATLLPGETLRAAPEIDYLVRGEGEETVVELARAIETGGPVDGIKGLTYRRGDKIIANEDRLTLVDIKALPMPAYHLLAGYRYRPHPPHGLASPFTAMVTSRGCPHRCAYCSKPIFGNRFRAQTPEAVIEQIDRLYRVFGYREIAFYDDVFTLDKKRVHAICEELVKRKLRIKWTCETRVNLVDEDLLEAMKRAGCYAVAYGIESASPAILELLHKDISLEMVERVIRATRKAGIQTVGYLMIGSPGETPETIAETLDFAKRLKLDYAQFSVTTPFPATELYDLYRREHPEPVPWESFSYTGATRDTTPVFESEALSRADIRAWEKRAYRGFYLRPGYIWQRLTRMRSRGEFLMTAKGVLMLARDLRR